MLSWTEPAVPVLPHDETVGAPPLRLHDTASAQTRPLAAGPVVRLYVCGITPYDATHLGHALTYLTYDLLVRVLRDAGHDVHYTQNVTDVDDPLLERATRTGVAWDDLAAREVQRFREDMSALRVIPPSAYIGAVEAIPDVWALIERLRAAGATYELDGDVYFSVGAAPALGAVAGLTRDEMVALSRERGGDPDRPGKKDPLDPLVWLAARPGEPSWPSPLGEGRPGWHVECAAIARQTLGLPLDVQGGGADLAFPHHELCAAEAEVVMGERPFARCYVHTALLSYDGHKMSKSRGNLVFVSRLLADGVDPMALRLALSSERYGVPWEWRDDVLRDAGHRLERWRAAARLPAAAPGAPVLAELRRALADDLDAPGALRAVDAWAEESLILGGRDEDAPALVRASVDALLGVAL
jgi:L-cysteine:1D-myo-inositol 2-amino-2-deoxy-alpha-D-glucopyranoside ligase